MPRRSLPPKAPPPPRPSAADRGYDRNWRRERAAWLAQFPLCAIHLQAGEIEPATVVDHKVPHEGQQDPAFWNRENWQSLCKACHDKKTRQESRGPRR
ncbi:MAG: HNH endonuclease [Pirellulaceae bacterium]|nr:HNH endonuclease [Pirellulaceae bacterium]